MPDGLQLVMVEKTALTPTQQQMIIDRLALPEHRNDKGPPEVWGYPSGLGLLAYFEPISGRLVALVEASGINNVQPGWWIDSDFRRKGYGNTVVDMLAVYLKARGVTRIGRMAITTYQQQYDEASSKLAQRLRRHFDETPAPRRAGTIR